MLTYYVLERRNNEGVNVVYEPVAAFGDFAVVDPWLEGLPKREGVVLAGEPTFSEVSTQPLPQKNVEAAAQPESPEEAEARRPVESVPERSESATRKAAGDQEPPFSGLGDEEEVNPRKVEPPPLGGGTSTPPPPPEKVEPEPTPVPTTGGIDRERMVIENPPAKTEAGPLIEIVVYDRATHLMARGSQRYVGAVQEALRRHGLPV